MVFAVKITRGFSTTAFQAAQLVRPSIPVFGIDGRYSIALYSAATKQKKLEAVEKDINTLNDLWHKDTKLREYFLSPVNTRDEKKHVFLGVAKKKNFTDLMQNLFGVVADHTRFDKLEIILKTYMKLMSAHRGEVQVEITTAKPLDADSTKQVTSAVQGFVKSGQKLNIATKVDPSIIGGMIVSIGDKYVDMSIANRIKQCAKSIEEAL